MMDTEGVYVATSFILGYCFFRVPGCIDFKCSWHGGGYYWHRVLYLNQGL